MNQLKWRMNILSNFIINFKIFIFLYKLLVKILNQVFVNYIKSEIYILYTRKFTLLTIEITYLDAHPLPLLPLHHP